MVTRPEINAWVLVHGKYKARVYQHYKDKLNVVGIQYDPSAGFSYEGSWVKGINIVCLKPITK
jgi:hypothetical protein